MHRTLLRVVASALLMLAGSSVVAQSPAPAPKAAGGETARKLGLSVKPFTGDFDQMLERRMIRVYSPYSRSLYFIDKGRERGLGAELVRDFER